VLKYIPFTFRNLLRNRRRTILTVLSVSISLFLLSLLFTVYTAFYHRERPPEQARRLITRHKVSLTHVLPESYGSRIASVSGVEGVMIQNWFGGIYIDDRPEHMFARFGVEADKLFDVYTEWTVPPEQLEAFLRDRTGIAVGKTIAEQNNLSLGQRITIKGDIYPFDLELTVRAIFEGRDDTVTFFHRKYLEEGLPEGYKGNAGVFVIQAAGAEDVPRIAREVDEMFRNAPQPTKTESAAAFELAFVNQIGNIKLFLLSIAGAVVFTILLVSGNTVAMSVRERIREIGVLKTLGFTSSVVLAMIIVEAIAMALLGGVLGVAFCFLVTQTMRNVMVSFFSGFVMPLWGIPICLAAAALIGLLSSVIPATIASRTQITEALRHTG
jgi:putative ABC transport system permease protein